MGLLLLSLPAAAVAQVAGQANGQVLWVGFNNIYRPDCWTPMLVQVTNHSAENGVYQINVVQEDLDRDLVSFGPQNLTLGGNAEGQGTGDKFWIYFRPQPSGLPDAQSTVADLDRHLRVVLAKDGKQIATLPFTQTITNIDPRRGDGDGHRSTKLVLFVGEGDRPVIPKYAEMFGLLEDVVAVPCRVSDLPDNVIGYEAVDQIVWLDANAGQLERGTGTIVLDALTQWVRQGGHLVVCQPTESAKIKPFLPMLPVVTDESGVKLVDSRDISPLRRMAGVEQSGFDKEWDGLDHTFKIGRAPATPDAKVDEWMQWPDGPSTPFLARRGVGMGMVTWVALDLGNPTITDQAKRRWRAVWDRVFDWNNANVPEDWKKPDTMDDPWAVTGISDLGAAIGPKTMDLTSKAAYLISLAIFFFIAYWAIAGPGMYFLLRAKNRAQLSWFFFGLTAAAATGLTWLIVMVVVRGPPEMRHLTTIRYSPDQDTAIIASRFGLYIPQDNLHEKIGLTGTAADQVSYVTPFPMHPQFVGNDDSFPSYLEYSVPVRSTQDTAAPDITVPYRSTLKKFEAVWVGSSKSKIDLADGTSAIQLVSPADGYLHGTLVNHSGFDLVDVYFAFKFPRAGHFADKEVSAVDDDWLVYLPSWKNNDPLDLNTIVKNRLMNLDKAGGLQPGQDKIVAGWLQDDMYWERYWAKQGGHIADVDALGSAFPMMAVWDRIRPWHNRKDDTSHIELFHRGGRQLNMSTILSSGRLAIFGVAGDGTASPLPLTVADAPVSGNGKTLVEFALPLDRSKAIKLPGTRPVEAEH